MALPVKPTPCLKGRDAKKFEKKLFDDLKKPTKLVDTPKLNQAKRKLEEYASKGGQK